MSEQPLFVEPVTGLRTWAVRGDPPRLMGIGQGREVSWRLDGRWTTARCLVRDHRAPDDECGCGLYAYHPFTEEVRFLPRRARGALLTGIVESRGRVELHEDGFRAQYARPVALFLPPRHLLPLDQQECVFALACEAESRVELVELPSPDHAREWCEVNGFGLSDAVVADLLREVLPELGEEVEDW